MVSNRINESVKVYAVYNEAGNRHSPHDRLKPVMFVWRNQEYRVQDVTYVWRESRGESELYHYAVSDGANVYELCYETHSFNWTLSSVSCEE
jgi:hypothetical protein